MFVAAEIILKFEYINELINNYARQHIEQKEGVEFFYC